jgi:hypothetical protein
MKTLQNIGPGLGVDSWSGDPQIHRVLQFIVGCFGLDSVFLTLNIPSGVPPGPQTVIFCDPVVTIATDVLLMFVCVPHKLKINIM